MLQAIEEDQDVLRDPFVHGAGNRLKAGVLWPTRRHLGGRCPSLLSAKRLLPFQGVDGCRVVPEDLTR